MLVSWICEEKIIKQSGFRVGLVLILGIAYTNLKNFFWVPYDQVSIIAGGQAALPVV